MVSVTHLLWLAWSFSPESYAAPATPTPHSYTQPQAISNADDLGYTFLTAAGSSTLPTVHPSPVDDPSYEECELILPIARFDSGAHYSL